MLEGQTCMNDFLNEFGMFSMTRFLCRSWKVIHEDAENATEDTDEKESVQYPEWDAEQWQPEVAFDFQEPIFENSFDLLDSGKQEGFERQGSQRDQRRREQSWEETGRDTCQEGKGVSHVRFDWYLS